MKRLYDAFLVSLKAQMRPEALSYKTFLTEKTFLAGEPFSFDGHEYQEYICDVLEANPGKTINVSKPSQIGISELFNRIVLAALAVRPRTSALVSFPSITFSQEVFKTRMASIIKESPYLDLMLDRANDSASVKGFINGSIMYALGGSRQSNSSLLNRPASAVFCAEVDRPDTDIMSGYATRMVHTKEDERLTLNVSTPTIDGIGINGMIQQCRYVHVPYVKCLHCNHEFLPDYYDNVVIPGYTEPLQMLTQASAAKLDLSETYLECENCKKPLDYDTSTTAWRIRENLDGSLDEIGIELNPFIIMSFRSMAALVRDSVKMSSDIEFINQCLGKVAARSQSSIDVSAIIFMTKRTQGPKVFGLDMGKRCHYLRGVISPDTTIHVEDASIINLPDLEGFLQEEHAKHIFSSGVMDAQPYADLVYRLVKEYPRLFSAIYVSPNPPKPELFSLKMSDKLGEMVRQVSINKPLAMDSFVGNLGDTYTFEPGIYDTILVKHFTDMRRVRDYRFNEMIYKWMKSSKGEDHFFHTAVYLFMAARMAYLGINTAIAVPTVIRTINIEEARRKLRR